MKRIAGAVALILVAHAAFAEDTQWVGKPDCRIVDQAPGFKRVEVSWTGACKDGYADGEGKLEFVRRRKVLVRFVGELRRGAPEGTGYLARHDGTIYEGDFKDGMQDGKGVESSWFGQYDGDFRAGKHDGYGRATFALGGSYDGEWKEGLFHGKGTAVYASGRVFTGEFARGRVAGEPQQEMSETKYKLSTDKPQAGFNLPGTRQVASTDGLPFDKGYEEMTPAEQAVVRSWYPLLDKDDEPPFPEAGTESLFSRLSEMMRDDGEDGVLRMTIDVDSSGKPTRAAVTQTPNREMAQVAMAVLMREKFRPARCAGKPCAMKFPFQAIFDRR